MLRIRPLLFAVTLLSFAGCQEDMTTEKQTWETTTQGWATKVDKLKKDQEALVAKVKAVATPDGDAALAGDKATLEKSVATGGTAIGDAEKAIATAKTSIESLMAAGKKVPVQAALGTTKSTVDGVLAKADSLLIAANGAVDTLNQKIAQARAAGDAAKARAEAWAAELKKKGGALSIDDIRFNAEALDVEKSKIGLTSLISALKTCAELKADLTVTALGEAADLGTKRVEALKAHLVANGVNASVIGKTAGTVVKEGEEKVSVAITTPCK